MEENKTGAFLDRAFLKKVYRKAYIATVQVVVAGVKNEAEAADAISSFLTEVGLYEGYLVDWAYLKVGAQYLHSVEMLIPNEEEYEEGDFLA